MARQARLPWTALVGIAAALVGCPGCAIFIENKYSVFGIDRLTTDSEARARTISVFAIVAVAVLSACVGVASFVLGSRWRHRRQRKAEMAHQAARDSQHGAGDGASGVTGTGTPETQDERPQPPFSESN